jgi:uncharacterized membrane protein YeaQ/YmgE (transglycosylase-associated protein family)
MDFTSLFVACLIVWFICGAMAGRIASHKKAENAGFWYGVLLGPFGVIAAGFLDGRPQCPRCGGRLNQGTDGGYPMCQHCGTELDWTHGQPLIPEMVESLREAYESEPTPAESEPTCPEYDGRPKFDEWGNPLDTDKQEATAAK